MTSWAKLAIPTILGGSVASYGAIEGFNVFYSDKYKTVPLTLPVEKPEARDCSGGYGHKPLVCFNDSTYLKWLKDKGELSNRRDLDTHFYDLFNL
ncbi:hypothetical protein MHLP_02425 [Candidatus Mycoplasma haematolamae str. Purdue]|uniref:Uncharacterized protein n=1 Tax=Mycoplasma haematolamae (strain Purdue) TaxID=1212765 RepID=I7B9W8_MYCHA|nr:hypothetical protein [Candidatus Mycoplasma haematolamae]AFO52065.1 hypothetical protein MHLP_02425 [Candidatus Mycoplasma haematolamae str. Purdue]